MNRKKSLFNQIVDYENIRLAWLKARKGKNSKKVVRRFSENVNENLLKVQNNLKSTPPVLNSYAQFKIFDPKERIISVVPFIDRVMHHAIINILEPIFERQFVFHTYACRVGKGTHAAARYAFKKAKSCKYFLKLDVRKFFDSIDHAVLKSSLCRIIKDSRCLELLFLLIDSYSINQIDLKYLGKKGLPIGNLTSQFFANFYLSALDHFVLEQKKPCGYVRYMDDIVVFENSKEKLKDTLFCIQEFCSERLKLSLKIPILGLCKNGVPFLGWNISCKKIGILKTTRRRMKNKLNQIQNDFLNGRTTLKKSQERKLAVLAARSL